MSANELVFWNFFLSSKYKPENAFHNNFDENLKLSTLTFHSERIHRQRWSVLCAADSTTLKKTTRSQYYDTLLFYGF